MKKTLPVLVTAGFKVDEDDFVTRCVAVPRHYTLGDLHLILQLAFAWKAYHLHEFRIAQHDYAIFCDWDTDRNGHVKDADKVTLASLIARDRSTVFGYEYDFGDSWTLQVELEEVEDGDKIGVPYCESGCAAAPPEDCGSMPGFEDIRENPEAQRKWLDQSGYTNWHKEWFPMEEVNAALKHYFSQVKPGSGPNACTEHTRENALLGEAIRMVIPGLKKS